MIVTRFHNQMCFSNFLQRYIIIPFRLLCVFDIFVFVLLRTLITQFSPFQLAYESARINCGEFRPHVPASLSDNVVSHSRVLKTSFLSAVLTSTWRLLKNRLVYFSHYFLLFLF